ncbi:flagellar basal body-associated FliL family protein [Halonatronum saccharophilum]|uniref:flagellar basal body-associated FliL family protein n=1 Tax=Halonatronum saccharophilum TaxID=150060 RepID=UPI0004814907|nr:flagellar basal body-associated FliL family protein [Halonatronum saccharophilum]
MSGEKGNLNLTIIIAVVLSVLLATGSSYFMFSRLVDTDNAGTTNVNSENRELGPTTDIGDFLVNLDGGRRFVRVSMVLEVNNSRVTREVDERTPQIRDLIISVLRSKSHDEVITEGGSRTLRTEIMNKINERLIEGQITNVFFTEFVIQ